MSNLDKQYLEIVKGLIQYLMSTMNQGLSFGAHKMLELPNVVSNNRKLDIKIYLHFHKGKVIEVETLGVHWTMSTT